MTSVFTQRRTLSTMLGTWAAVCYAVAPGIVDRLQSIIYRLGSSPKAPPRRARRYRCGPNAAPLRRSSPTC
jgi:hypothetical protein